MGKGKYDILAPNLLGLEIPNNVFVKMCKDLEMDKLNLIGSLDDSDVISLFGYNYQVGLASNSCGSSFYELLTKMEFPAFNDKDVDVVKTIGKLEESLLRYINLCKNEIVLEKQRFKLITLCEDKDIQSELIEYEYRYKSLFFESIKYVYDWIIEIWSCPDIKLVKCSLEEIIIYLKEEISNIEYILETSKLRLLILERLTTEQNGFEWLLIYEYELMLSEFGEPLEEDEDYEEEVCFPSDCDED